MDLKSYSETTKQHDNPKEKGMNENDVRRAINHFSKMSNDQLMRELQKHLVAKRAQGREHEIQSVIERIKPLLNDEQRRRLSEIMEQF